MRTGLRLALAAVAMGAVLVTGCSGPGGVDPAKLEGSWVLESFGGTTELKAADPSVKTEITFSSGEVTGNGGVNSFGSRYTADDSGALSLEPVVSTKMAGPEPAMSQENAFFAALEKVASFSFDGDKLVLSDKGNNTLAVLIPK